MFSVKLMALCHSDIGVFYVNVPHGYIQTRWDIYRKRQWRKIVLLDIHRKKMNEKKVFGRTVGLITTVVA